MAKRSAKCSPLIQKLLKDGENYHADAVSYDTRSHKQCNTTYGREKVAKMPK